MCILEPSLRALSFGKSVHLMRLLLSQNFPGEDYITTQPFLCPEVLLRRCICWSSFQKKKKKRCDAAAEWKFEESTVNPMYLVLSVLFSPHSMTYAEDLSKY